MDARSEVQILEKPDSLNWDIIHRVLWKSHEQNRMKGIVMSYPSLSGEEIKAKIEGTGKMFVATLNEDVVGTFAVMLKKKPLWCGNEVYAYVCFVSVLPDYRGKGIYKAMSLRMEQEAASLGVNCLMFDTHEGNRRMIEINKKNNYKSVDLFLYKDHFNEVLVKWLKGCPYSDAYCKSQFLLRKYYKKIR